MEGVLDQAAWRVAELSTTDGRYDAPVSFRFGRISTAGLAGYLRVCGRLNVIRVGSANTQPAATGRTYFMERTSPQ